METTTVNATRCVWVPCAEVRQEGGYFSVFVGGMRLVDRESFTLAHEIAQRVNNPGLDDFTESTEVARSIRRTRARGSARGVGPDRGCIVNEHVDSEVSRCVFALRSLSAAARARAAYDLGWMVSDAVPAVPALVEALADSDVEVRRNAAWALGEIAWAVGRIDSEAVPALIAALADSGPDVRRNAAWALGRLGSEAVSAVPALIGALDDPDYEVRDRAATALGRMGREAVPAVPALIGALGDPAPQVRMSAAWALGHVGPEAAPAVPALRALANDADAFVRAEARDALDRIGGAS